MEQPRHAIHGLPISPFRDKPTWAGDQIWASFPPTRHRYDLELAPPEFSPSPLAPIKESYNFRGSIPSSQHIQPNRTSTPKSQQQHTSVHVGECNPGGCNPGECNSRYLCAGVTLDSSVVLYLVIISWYASSEGASLRYASSECAS
jgi:hypothetical protein